MDDKNKFFHEPPKAPVNSEGSSSSSIHPDGEKEFLNRCLGIIKDCMPETMDLETRRRTLENMYQALKALLGLQVPEHCFGLSDVIHAIASEQYERTYGLQDIQDLIHMAFDKNYHRGREEHQKWSWLLDVLQVTFCNRLFSVMCFFTNDLHINCFELIRRNNRDTTFRDEVFAVLNSSELLELSYSPEGKLMAKHALDYAISSVSTDCVVRFVEGNPRLVDFAHVSVSLDTRCEYSHKKMIVEREKIFDCLTKHYPLSHEELDQSLCIASTNYRISQSTVKKLLDRGANPNYLYLNTPQHTLGFRHIKLVDESTFRKRDIKQTSALLEACASVFDNHVANAEDHFKLIQLLLDRDANPNLRLDDVGHHTVFQLVTLLWCDSAKLAFSSPQACNEILKMLIRSGADSSIQNAQGQNCFDLLREVEESKEQEFRELYEQYSLKDQASCILL